MGGKPGPKRTDTQRDRDRARVSALYLEGKLISDIQVVVNREAENYEVSYQTIWNDLKWARKRWQKEAARSISEVVAEQLKKLDLLEREYYSAWIESMNEKKSSSVRTKANRKGPGRGKKGDNGNGDDDAGLVPIALEKWEKREERLGDPRYLDGYLSCVRERMKILRPEGPDPADTAKDMADKVREALSDIEDVMNVEPPEEPKDVEAEKEPVAGTKQGT